MKKYKILVVNKTYIAYGLDRALDYAKRESLVCFRTSVLDGNKKIATYEWGCVKEWNI